MTLIDIVASMLEADPTFMAATLIFAALFIYCMLHDYSTRLACRRLGFEAGLRELWPYTLLSMALLLFAFVMLTYVGDSLATLAGGQHSQQSFAGWLMGG